MNPKATRATAPVVVAALTIEAMTIPVACERLAAGETLLSGAALPQIFVCVPSQRDYLAPAEHIEPTGNMRVPAGYVRAAAFASAGSSISSTSSAAITISIPVKV